ncbi:hypothetical protein V8J88_03955 [Massilia sp. W12]|uniref:hypothetical protein n=1 Tax=Massilia sp. W12 TaxID=3126507 RepID=UPI0030D16C11
MENTNQTNAEWSALTCLSLAQLQAAHAQGVLHAISCFPPRKDSKNDFLYPLWEVFADLFVPGYDGAKCVPVTLQHCNSLMDLQRTFSEMGFSNLEFSIKGYNTAENRHSTDECYFHAEIPCRQQNPFWRAGFQAAWINAASDVAKPMTDAEFAAWNAGVAFAEAMQ